MRIMIFKPCAHTYNEKLVGSIAEWERAREAGRVEFKGENEGGRCGLMTKAPPGILSSGPKSQEELSGRPIRGRPIWTRRGGRRPGARGRGSTWTMGLNGVRLS